MLRLGSRRDRPREGNEPIEKPIRLHDKSPLVATLKPREVTALPAAQTPQSATTDSARFSRHPDLTSGSNKCRNRGLDSGLLSSRTRSEEHTSELHSLMRISYAVFCLKKKKHNTNKNTTQIFMIESATIHPRIIQNIVTNIQYTHNTESTELMLEIHINHLI